MAQEADRIPEVEAMKIAFLEARALTSLGAITAAAHALESARLKTLTVLGELAVARAGGSSDRLDMELRATAAEAAARTHVSDRAVQRQMGDAMALVGTWPTVLRAFEECRIGRGHMAAIAEAGSVLCSSDVTDEQRAAYADEMIALGQTTTPARLSKAARKAADACLPEPLVERHVRARDQRHVRVTPGDDGMAHLYAFLPAVLAQGIDDRLRKGSRGKAKDDPRTVDQWRADALCELLLTGSGSPNVTTGADGVAVERPGLLASIQPVLQITVPVTTITGVTQTPGMLDGAQPVDAETVRILAGVASTWERLLTDPIRGTVVEVDTYTPTAAQKRLLRARDQWCRFPGCGAKARDDDIDHTIAWDDGGTTSLGNLAHLCRRHHTLKHATAWQVEQTTPGELTWTSPLGHEYVDRPPPVGPRFRPPSMDEIWGAPPPGDPSDDLPF